MESAELTRMLSEAVEKRNARIEKAVAEIVDASAEYLRLVECCRGLRPLVKGEFPAILPEPLNLSQFEGWDDLAVSLGDPTSDLERIRRVLPPLNEPFSMADLKRRFADVYAGYELKQSVWPPYIQRLRHDGDIVPYQRSNAGKPGLYVVAGSSIAPEDGLKSQPDIAIDILREAGKPMTIRDIINEFRKRGIGKDSKISTLECNLMRGLRRRQDQVHLRASKWRLNSTATEA